MQLDWILGDNKLLAEHYEQYLNILKKNELEQMLLIGGQQAIETTFRWHNFSAADNLLKIWIDNVLSSNNPYPILRYAQNAIKNERFWEISVLLEKSLKSPERWGQKQTYAEFLNSSALYGLYEMLLNANEITSEIKKEQVNWVLTNTNKDDLLKALKQSIENAQATISKFENPSKEIQAIKKELDEMSKTISTEQ